MILYHGTTKAIAHRILREGIRVDPKHIMARNPSWTREFAEELAKSEGMSLATDPELAGQFGTVILRINLPVNWPLQHGSGWDEYQTFKDIPPKFIKVYKVQEKRVRTYRGTA